MCWRINIHPQSPNTASRVRIPLKKTLAFINLIRFFGKEPRKDINAEEAVASGAAYRAAVEVKPAHELKDTALGHAKLKDVCPLHLGLKTEAPEGRDFCILIPKNSGLPTQVRKVFRTAYQNQCSFEFHIYQGEHASDCRENERIAEFTLADLPQRAAGQVSAAVTFRIDENAMLSVTAVCTDDSSLSAGMSVGEDFTRVRAIHSAEYSPTVGWRSLPHRNRGGQEDDETPCTPKGEAEASHEMYASV